MPEAERASVREKYFIEVLPLTTHRFDFACTLGAFQQVNGQEIPAPIKRFEAWAAEL